MEDPETDSDHGRQRANAHVQGIAVVHCKVQGGLRTLSLLAADEGFLSEVMDQGIADWKGIPLPATFEAAVLSALDEGLLSSPVPIHVPRRDGGELEAQVRALNDGIVVVQLQPKLERVPSILAGTLANLFASAPVGFLVVDRSGVIALANPEAERIFGYTGRALSGERVDQLVADSNGHGRLREGFMKGGHMRMMGAGRDLHGVRANGSRVPVEVALAPLRHNGQDAVLAVIADITDRRKAPASVHDSENRYQAILDNAVEAFISMDSRGTVVHWNRAAELMFGWVAAEAIGMPMAELIIPARYRPSHFEGVARNLKGASQRDLNRRVELTAMRKNGEEFPVELSIGVLQTAAGPLFHAFINDLTEKKQLEKQVESLLLEHEGLEPGTARSHGLETRFMRLLNNMLEGVQVLGPDLRYRFLNDSAVAQSRYSRGQLIGRTMTEMFPGVESTPLHRCLLDCLAQQAPMALVNEFTFPDGHVGFFELSIQPIPDGILILSTDVTERRRAERDLQRKKQQLEQQNAELERFAYVASHDLQEPLRMVASYLQLLERRYGDRLDGEARDFMNYAIDGAQRMKKLISDLLVYSQADRPLPSARIVVSDVLDDVLHDLAASINEAGVSVEVQGTLPVLQAPRTVLRQILQNLISNAIKFRHPDRSPKVIISGHAHDTDATISISDNGIGIDPDIGNSIFKPFIRHAESVSIPGTGIGLSIVRKHVTRLGGRIWYESRRGNGSTFHFNLPINPIVP